jgi:hypothetical protein
MIPEHGISNFKHREQGPDPRRIGAKREARGGPDLVQISYLSYLVGRTGRGRPRGRYSFRSRQEQLLQKIENIKKSHTENLSLHS